MKNFDFLYLLLISRYKIDDSLKNILNNLVLYAYYATEYKMNK